jgi:hypothetical protein
VSGDWRTPFERALDEDPSNQQVRRDLADHLSERGDPDAEAVLWLAERGKWPLPLLPGSSGPRWNWFSEAGRATKWLTSDAALLPARVFSELRRFGFYGTRREAEADFCRAYFEAKDAGWDPASG